MSATVNMHEAKTNFSKLVERALAGEDIIVARAGKPAVRLVPVVDEPKPRRTPGGWPALKNVPDSVWFDPMPEEELMWWEGRHPDQQTP